MHTGNTRILDVLDQAERGRLLQQAVPRSLAHGEALFFAGEITNRVHLLLEGVVKCVGRDPQGNETILGLVVPGELIGEIAALDGAEHPTDAVAAITCRLLGFDAATLMNALSKEPLAALELARLLAARNRWTYEVTLERAASEVPARLAGRLLDLGRMLGRYDDRSIYLELPLGQQDLARLAGMCRESACKTLRGFKRSGLVDYRGRRLRILRPDALERIKCAGRVARPFPSIDAEDRRLSRPIAGS